PRELFLASTARRGVEPEALMPASGLALGARQRVFLVRLGVQEHGKIAADWTKPAGEQLLRRGADDNVISIRDRSSEQLVAHRAADAIGLHAGRPVRRFIVPDGSVALTLRFGLQRPPCARRPEYRLRVAAGAR